MYTEDVFDLVNFNRQAGAFMHSLGRPKVECMREYKKLMAKLKAKQQQQQQAA